MANREPTFLSSIRIEALVEDLLQTHFPVFAVWNVAVQNAPDCAMLFASSGDGDAVSFGRQSHGKGIATSEAELRVLDGLDQLVQLTGLLRGWEFIETRWKIGMRNHGR